MSCVYTSRTFFKFEHFIYTIKGPQSEENALLKLWKAITRYKKTLETEKKDSLAVAIHKTFIFDQSKLSISVPDEMLRLMDPDSHCDRPSSAALKELYKLASGENMTTLIMEFLQTEGTECGSQMFAREREKVALNTKKVVLC